MLLVMVLDGDREHLLGVALADDVARKIHQGENFAATVA